MQDQYEDIAEILAKYPEISSTEDEILKEWISLSVVNQKIFEDLSSPEELLNMMKSVEQCKTEKGRLWQRVLNDIYARPDSAEKSAKVIWLRKWQTYAAAASVIIIASVFIYMWQLRKPGAATLPTPTVAKMNDASPGKYKAKLTLADGTVIILDSAKSGRLVQQGGLIVLNKSGKLIYEKVGETDKVLYNTLTTTKGETYATELSDGTKVWLNSQSTLRYPITFTGDVRKVEITGEAYFEVAPSIAMSANGTKAKRPFVVSVNGMEVEVLGTHFNINSYADEPAMKTTLLEGKVRVRSAATSEQVILQPGQQANLNNKTQKLAKLYNVDIEQAVAWKNGYFQFNDADISTVMREIVRWFDVKVVYEGSVPQRKFAGKIPKSSSLIQLLQILENMERLQTSPVQFKLQGNKIIVSP